MTYSSYTTDQQKIYQIGYKNVDRELDIVTILRTIHKLKAGLSTVIGHNKDLVQKTREKFLDNTTLKLYGTENDEEKMSDFDKFMEIRDRHALENPDINTVFLAKQAEGAIMIKLQKKLF